MSGAGRNYQNKPHHRARQQCDAVPNVWEGGGEGHRSAERARLAGVSEEMESELVLVERAYHTKQRPVRRNAHAAGVHAQACALATPLTPREKRKGGRRFNQGA